MAILLPRNPSFYRQEPSKPSWLLNKLRFNIFPTFSYLLHPGKSRDPRANRIFLHTLKLKAQSKYSFMISLVSRDMQTILWDSFLCLSVRLMKNLLRGCWSHSSALRHHTPRRAVLHEAFYSWWTQCVLLLLYMCHTWAWILQSLLKVIQAF